MIEVKPTLYLYPPVFNIHFPFALQILHSFYGVVIKEIITEEYNYL